MSTKKKKKDSHTHTQFQHDNIYIYIYGKCRKMSLLSLLSDNKIQKKTQLTIAEKWTRMAIFK